MTQLTATFTVTIKTKPDGDYYFDHDDLVRNVVPWIEGGLDDRDDIAEVTITEQPAAVSAAVAPPTNQTALRDRNSGTGWYEVITPRATTCIAYVHEDGSLYLPEGDLTEEEFAFAAARGKAHRLVRADEQPAAGARQDETATETPKAARCTCQYIAESWIQMDHAPDCPAAGARQDGAET